MPSGDSLLISVGINYEPLRTYKLAPNERRAFRPIFLCNLSSDLVCRRTNCVMNVSSYNLLLIIHVFFKHDHVKYDTGFWRYEFLTPTVHISTLSFYWWRRISYADATLWCGLFMRLLSSKNISAISKLQHFVYSTLSFACCILII